MRLMRMIMMIGCWSGWRKQRVHGFSLLPSMCDFTWAFPALCPPRWLYGARNILFAKSLLLPEMLPATFTVRYACCLDEYPTEFSFLKCLKFAAPVVKPACGKGWLRGGASVFHAALAEQVR